MTLNAQITKLALSISAEILVKMPILVENQQNVKPKVTEQFANVQLDGEVIPQQSVSNVGFCHFDIHFTVVYPRFATFLIHQYLFR